MWLRIKLLASGLIIACFASVAQDRQEAFAMNLRLGRGMNMGNAFEAPTETAWGNPWKPSYFRMISGLGFRHVRVPIRWETAERSMASSPYTITSGFLERIREVVDSALRSKLHIIINMHHHDALYEDPAGQKERFLSQWNQIADYFQDYPDSLLFEVLNEPHGNLTPALWNDYFADALTEIRKTNPDRMVLMGVAEYGGIGGISKLVLPADENIILSVHYYNPFPFTHQGAEWVSGSNEWLGTEWLDTEGDRETVASEFAYAIQFSESNNIPIHVGEFGAYSKADTESRERWTTFLSRWFENNDMSWAYWEFSAGFGIYNPATDQYAAGLVDALLYRSMPEATPVFSKPMYTSDFSSGTDGWSLSLQGGAAGSLTASGGRLVPSISAGGTEAWHAQLVRHGINFREGRLYRISFSASANPARSITFYAGRASSPWSAYSAYNGATVATQETTYAFTFVMTNETDPAARLVFDLGTSTGEVRISSVKVEELTFAITSVHANHERQETLVYPNPVSSWLRIGEGRSYHTAQLTDLRGRLVASYNIADGDVTLDVSHIMPGIYILSLRAAGRIERIRVVKE